MGGVVDGGVGVSLLVAENVCDYSVTRLDRYGTDSSESKVLRSCVKSYG